LIQCSFLYSLLLSTSFLFPVCEEVLPRYEDPRDLLSGTMRGQYVLSSVDNSLKVFLTVKNDFDETIEGPAVLRGSIVIASARDPNVRKSFSLTASNLISTRQFNATTGVLTFDSGDSLGFLVSWDFRADDRNTNLRTSFFRFIVDPSCNSRCLTQPEDFTLTGEVTIFNKIATVRANALFPVCYVSNWVEPRFCPIVITVPACADRPTGIPGPCSIPGSAGN